jgi:glyoxylase-like metal-dependent hydrolase (beta-lactamase superfamily II)
MTERPIVKAFYEGKTGSLQYVVSDPETRAAAIIDPVWDFDEKVGRTCTKSADAIADYVSREGLRVVWVLDTHPHADHFSAAPYLKEKIGGQTAIGERVSEVQQIWKKIYNLPDHFPTDGSQWDRLFKDGDTFKIGEISCKVMLSPGHTLASVTYVIGDAAFVHDTLMMPDSGTSRADFPGGSASELYRSIQQILSLPEDTRVFVGHDYGKDGRPVAWESTVRTQRETNIHLRDGTTEEQFVKLREARDAKLPLPHLMLAALQVNIRGGRAPEPDANGVRYLRIPLEQLSGFSEVCDCGS